MFAAATANSDTVTIAEAWGNFEAGTNAEFHAVIQSSAATRGNLQFAVTVGPQPIVRREIEVSAEAGQPALVPIQFAVPPLKDDVAVRALLTVAFQPQSTGPGKAVSSVEKTLWFFAANPFANHEASLNDKKIALFDPEGKTQKRLEQAGIPFVLVPRLDAIPNIKEGMLIIGEGISLRDFRTLTDVCLAAAARGVPVLCLALKDGQFRLIDNNDKSLPSPYAMSFRHNDIITNLDKRLDAVAWPPDGIVAARTLAISGDRGPIVGEVIDKTGEWPWMELTFNNHGKAIFCQFDIIEKWNTGPAPRYLLAALLEYLSKNNSQ
jgi:hypothetical protein